MIYPEFIIVGLLGAIYIGSAAQPVVVPKNVLAQVGTAARFNCTTIHNEPVYWTTKPYGSPATHDIYIGEKFLLDDFGTSGRFSVEANSTLRRYDLVIKNVKQSDAGVYICIDERGLGKKAYTELAVWDTLTCQEDQRQDSYMGENVFGLDQDTISFACRINYKGNTRPQLIWSVGGRKLKATQGTESGIASSPLILVATSKLDGTNVTCEAVIRDSSSEDTRTGVLWTSDTIRIKYAVLKMEVAKECPTGENTLDCNPPCAYKMETVNDTQRCAVSYSAGTDVKMFYFYQSSAHSSDTDSVYATGMNVMVIVLYALGSSCLLVFFLLLAYLLWKERFSRKMKQNRPEDIPLKANGKQSISEQHADC